MVSPTTTEMSVNILKKAFVHRTAGILTGAVATVVVTLATSLGSVAQAYDLKGYSPSACRTYGPYESSGVHYYHDRVRNTSGDYRMVICPAIMDSEAASPLIGLNVYFSKATASPAFYCYVFSVNLANSGYRWTYNADTTNVGIRGLYNTSIQSFRYGSNSVICGMPAGSELLHYYAGET
jgi:hypothetical protein